MSCCDGQTLLDRFNLARVSLVCFYPTRRRPGEGYNGFIDCLTRHHLRLLGIVVRSLRQRLVERAGRHWRTLGFIVLGVDGTKINVPRSDDNINTFGVANKKHAGPEMLLTGVFHLATQTLWSYLHDLARGSERAMLQRMIPELPKDSLVVADAGFVGWNTMRALLDAGQHFLIRAGANVKLITALGCDASGHGGIVHLWPSGQRKKNVPPITLRRVMVKDARGREMCLLTSVRDEARLCDAQIIELYALRWGVEVAYRWLKTDLHGRKMLSASSAHARVELDWTMVGLWCLTLVALSEETIKEGLSLAGVLRVVRETLTRRHRSRRGPLIEQLRAARRDSYRRTSNKSKRHHPKRSRLHRCKTPIARMASAQEIEQYQALLAQAA